MRFPRPNPERALRYRAAGHWRDESIHGLIGAITAGRSHKVALRDASGAELTYGALDEQSSCLAGFLAGRGVGGLPTARSTSSRAAWRDFSPGAA